MERKDLSTLHYGCPEIELSYKNPIPVEDRIKISDSKSAAALFRKTWNEDTMDLREEFKVILLNFRGHVLGVLPLTVGNAVNCPVDLPLLFAAALKALAKGIIVAHNHPAGVSNPSKADEEITSRMAQIATLMDIKLMDHIILTRFGYYSFADKGLL